MHNVALNYRTLLSVINVLNSQRNRQSLFRAITEQLTKVVRWTRQHHRVRFAVGRISLLCDRNEPAQSRAPKRRDDSSRRQRGGLGL